MTNSQSDLRSTGQTGDAVSPRDLSSDGHQPERKRKRKRRPRRKSRRGGGGRTPTTEGAAGLSTDGSQRIENAGTTQTGGRSSCVEGRTNRQRPGSGRGCRSTGDSVNGRSAAAGPASQPRSQNRSDSRGQRASERSGAQRSGSRATGARGQKREGLLPVVERRRVIPMPGNRALGLREGQTFRPRPLPLLTKPPGLALVTG